MYPHPFSVLQVGKFYAPHRGGIETHMEVLCQGLKTRVALDVLVANNNRKTVREVVDGISVTRLGSLGRLASTPITLSIGTELKRRPADIVHIHGPNPIPTLAYLKYRPNSRLILSYHAVIVRQRLLGALYRPFERKIMGLADAIIVSSAYTLRCSELLQEYSAKTRVIPYGMVVREKKTDPEVIRLVRKQYGDRVVLSVGRMVYYKGFEYLIRAMKAVNGKLLIIGNGPLHSDLKRLVREENLTDRVFLLGDVPNTGHYYSSADVFVLPSVERTESFGIVQIEAMMAGIPVINTWLETAVPSVSLNGITGVTVPPRDADALAQSINLLLDDPERRRKFGMAARARVEKEFNAEAMVERTLELYREVLSR